MRLLRKLLDFWLLMAPNDKFSNEKFFLQMVSAAGWWERSRDQMRKKQQMRDVTTSHLWLPAKKL